jgi:hypothetical protein
MLTHNTWKTLWEHSGSLWAYGNGEKYEGGRVLFIGPEKQRTSGQGAYVWWFLPSGSMAVSYVQVLSRGYSKSSIRLVVPCTSASTVCRAYIRWSPHIRLHYRQQRTSARPSVRPPKSPNYPSSILSDPKPKLTPPTKPLMPS